MPGHAKHQAQATDLALDVTAEELVTVFNGGGRTGHTDELRAIGRWARLGHWRHHGLGWLPLALADFEKPDPRSQRFDQDLALYTMP